MAEDRAIGARDRWRLVLGREREKLSTSARRPALALDELYGDGRGEGSETIGRGGGQEAGFPSAREWSAELEALFGAEVREEVLGVAAELGRNAALLELDPEAVRPSIELLERVLSLKGGLPEAHLGKLRRIVQRVVEALVKALAVELRPALTGIGTPRPTRRPGGRLDLGRTLAANIRNARQCEDGEPLILPERLVYRSRGKRALAWRIVLVVDTSGSMEASVIYSAVVAAILAGVPWVDVRFLAFSTEIIDLSEHVDDPLALLLEVQIGGGTHIARALRHARTMVQIPARTLVVLLTDFEEGYPVEGLLGEVRALGESGVRALGLAALDDRGQARYSRPIAEAVVAAGMPVAALSPLELARWIGEQVR